MIQVIKCPSCAAPLECDGDPIERCNFCGSNVSIDQNEFISPNSSGYDGLLKQAQQLKDILRLIRSGKKIEAIKVYRETFGGGLKECKDAVERLERGQSINFRQIKPITIDGAAVTKTVKTIGFASLLVVLISIMIGVATIGFVFYMVSSNPGRTISKTKLPIPGFEKPSNFKEILRIGGEGNGAGKFVDNRAIAVDGDGRIYSADYQGGRVQVFDETGKFLTQWFVKDKNSIILSLAAIRNGKVFVTQSGGRILSYEGSAGALLNEAKLDLTSALYPTSDGKIIAASKSDILLIDESLKVVSNFKDAAKQAGEGKEFRYLAVNGLGEIFAASDDGQDVFKFSSDGKFVDRLKIKPTRIMGFAIDSKGRLFISDASKIWIYKDDGSLLDSTDANQCFALTFSDKDELLTATRPYVLKYQLNQ